MNVVSFMMSSSIFFTVAFNIYSFYCVVVKCDDLTSNIKAIGATSIVELVERGIGPTPVPPFTNME